jgi:hypothetical protein
MMQQNDNIWIPKLYVVVRKDLSIGAMACQGMHALTEFIFIHSEKAIDWYQNSNHLCFLEVNNVFELEELIFKAQKQNITYSSFKEPDFNHQLTAICFEASENSRDLLKDLKCAHKGTLKPF